MKLVPKRKVIDRSMGGSLSYYQMIQEAAEEAAEEADDAPSRYSGLAFVIDGGGAAITTGEKGHLPVPFDCTILSGELEADQSGSIKIDIWADTYANFLPTNADTICGANELEISSTTKDYDATLTSWTTELSAGQILAFNVDSCTTITRCTIMLRVRKL